MIENNMVKRIVRSFTEGGCPERISFLLKKDIQFQSYS